MRAARCTPGGSMLANSPRAQHPSHDEAGQQGGSQLGVGAGQTARPMGRECELQNDLTLARATSQGDFKVKFECLKVSITVPKSVL